MESVAKQSSAFEAGPPDCFPRNKSGVAVTLSGKVRAIADGVRSHSHAARSAGNMCDGLATSNQQPASPQLGQLTSSPAAL